MVRIVPEAYKQTGESHNWDVPVHTDWSGGGQGGRITASSFSAQQQITVIWVQAPDGS